MRSPTFTRGLSLRARLLLGVVALAAAGLVAADVATYTSLRSFLLHRVDQSLDAGHPQVEQTAFPRPAPGPAPARGPGPPAPGVDWYQVRTLEGRALRGGFLIQGGSPPKLPATIAIPARATAPDGERATYFTVPSRSGATRFRVRASIELQHPSRVLVIATSLSSVDGTLRRLLLIELLATGGVLLAIGGLGLWAVRVGLRPLRAIEATAAAIAAGDLTRRVEQAEERTEVGRLGIALNAMLAQIESAFRAREAERMSLLVEDLLLLARLDEGRPLERAPVELAEVVAEAVDAARAVEPERPFGVELEPLTVPGDRDRLRQVVDNLLANVRAHTPAGAPVRVAVRRVDDTAEISVADSGPGLDEAESAQVFERFYRADASRARAAGGAGLGLSIVAAVARAHGGDASARSTPGEGATFRIELPLAEEREDAASEGRPAAR